MAGHNVAKTPLRTPQVPTRSSSRLSKPSARKRALSSAAQQPPKKPKSTLRSHKAPIASSPSTEQEVIVLEEEVEEEVEEEEKEEEEEEEEEEPEEEKDDNNDTKPREAAEEEAIQQVPMKFMSTWRAVAGKEFLPGVESAVFEEHEIYMLCLETWKEDLLNFLHPRIF